ncbi:hypothetical protein B0H15DRAFT_954038 [Mycena belliarum]|uniref:Uncharacterized protein n=1 Tax=Mycena belliarum TaxID=1033014 RepID=A0AAD6XJN4_9AGAR|nr:hypothetical protein B0H15DRAFT_954038 [Mycena belliae]
MAVGIWAAQAFGSATSSLIKEDGAAERSIIPFPMSSPPAPFPFAESQHKYNVFARLKQFTAIAAVLDAHGWSSEGGAKVLLERALSDAGPDGPAPQFAFLLAVGRVRSHRCFVGPLGAFNGRFNNDLQKAKYSFILEDPIDDPVWHGAWAQSVLHLKVFEGDVCGGPTTNFIINEDNNEVALRFTKPVFEAKGENPPEVDTARWPVGGSNAGLLKDTCITHDARPFPLYDVNEQLVPMHQVERVLPGSLVAVTFRLIAHSFVRDGRNVDSMTGEVQQVEILKKGRPRPKTPFAGKRGLFRPPANLDIDGKLPGASAAPSGERFNRRQFSMTAAHATTQNPGPRPPQTLTPPAPPEFASHLRPEASPYGSHPFVFAPTSPNSAAQNVPHGADTAPGVAEPVTTGGSAPALASGVPIGLGLQFGLPTTSLLPSPASLDTVGNRASLSIWKAQGQTPVPKPQGQTPVPTREPLFLPDGDTAAPSFRDPSVLWSGTMFNSPNQLSVQSLNADGGQYHLNAHDGQYHRPDDISRFIHQDGSEDEAGGNDNTAKEGPGDIGTSIGDPPASPLRTGRRTIKRVRNAETDGGPSSKKARAVAA